MGLFGAFWIGLLVTYSQEEKLRKYGIEREFSEQVKSFLGWIVLVYVLMFVGYDLASDSICN